MMTYWGKWISSLVQLRNVVVTWNIVLEVGRISGNDLRQFLSSGRNSIWNGGELKGT